MQIKLFISVSAYCSFLEKFWLIGVIIYMHEKGLLNNIHQT